MRIVAIVLTMSVVVACGARQNVVQHGPTAVTYGDAPMTFMRPTPLLTPRYCDVKQLVKERYIHPDEGPRTQWWNPWSDREEFFTTCPRSGRELQLDTWEPASPRWDDSIASKTVPLISGLMFAGATLGAAQILGSHISSGLRNQATASPLNGDLDISTVNQFSGPATVTRPVGR